MYLQILRNDTERGVSQLVWKTNILKGLNAETALWCLQLGLEMSSMNITRFLTTFNCNFVRVCCFFRWISVNKLYGTSFFMKIAGHSHKL